MPAAVVVGGGIGGLAAAIVRHRIGRRVTVLERATEFTEPGAGPALRPNSPRALATLTALGLAERVRAIAGTNRTGGLRDQPSDLGGRPAGTHVWRRADA
ncbi:NAD-binding protein [Nonomuraea sp. NN258]|uniref:NAD-binding protein n=1 Tax=Nonomuraea antri TaxID=2730852 RepID=UPI0015685529|nr:NAD-binding protein [Nonomuraea antri]NRQ40523.1 NAD-binding protein [Nonomuraea antri]